MAVDPVGATLGALSLTMQLLDGCVKIYQYFVAATDMPANCRYMRTRLQMEYIRLLNWVEVAGLLDRDEEQDLPDSLKTDRLVLVAILTEIRALLEQFAELNGRYYQLRPDADSAAKEAATEVELVKEFDSLSLSYEKKARKRTHVRGTNHLIAMGRDIKAIVKNPRRLQWIAVDEEQFISLLSRLTQLNDYLHELMHEQQARDLEETTRRSYLELVQVRSSVEELRQLMVASFEDKAGDYSRAGAARARNNSILAVLADYKRINLASDSPANEKPPDYDSIISSTHLDYRKIKYEHADEEEEEEKEDELPEISKVRTDGEFDSDKGDKQSVWIEWKSYTSVPDKITRVEKPLSENVQRVKELVALLQRPHPADFCIPKCLGYFDEREHSDNSENDFRFGLVYIKPTDVEVISLSQLLDNLSMPSLSIRVRWARKVATCVLYLHAVNWLHKALKSDNVIFFSSQGNADLDSLRVSGFEYARPDREDAATKGSSTNSAWDALWDLYRPPEYQGIGVKRVYRKTFDLYSLGILLLEIAYWKSIDKIVAIADPRQATTEELQNIRDTLLTNPQHLDHIKANLGDRYHDAVRSCLEGKDAFGIVADENEMSPETGAKLQQGFTTRVVTPLEAITT